ncbi:hypothetical protein Taro_007239 [Colocasia esculenta]|uniref:DNA replication factor Cdt1 C-terminal domain-containing protein n=1 Tax=Colocasia esculenta TaxID=4460 RepID=A0A843U381_COLES|nr:hypothetical protein [Colocasia esculenta]
MSVYLQFYLVLRSECKDSDQAASGSSNISRSPELLLPSAASPATPRLISFLHFAIPASAGQGGLLLLRQDQALFHYPSFSSSSSSSSSSLRCFPPTLDDYSVICDSVFCRGGWGGGWTWVGHGSGHLRAIGARVPGIVGAGIIYLGDFLQKKLWDILASVTGPKQCHGFDMHGTSKAGRMEPEKHKEVRQSTLQFRCVKISHSEKSGDHPVANVQIKSDENQGFGFSFASPTPEKIIQPPRTRKSKEHSYHLRMEAENSKMLPDKGGNNELAAEAHDKMECTDVSFPKSFEQSPCLSIQSLEEKCQLSEKKFMLSHLAQMKFLFPEALHIEKTLVHDETSLCMKPDINVSVIVDAAKDIDDSHQASYADLCKVFHARLLNFLNTHPEESEIPEVPLPGTFMQGNPMISSNQLSERPSTEQLWPPSGGDDTLLAPSHLCPSFSQHFSGRMLDPENQMTEPFDSSISMISIDPINGHNEEIKIHQENDHPHPLPNNKLPTEIISNPEDYTCSQLYQRTPAKHTTMPIILMTETPSMSTPKRPVASPDLKLPSQTVMSNHSARRSLFYSPSKADKSALHSVADVTDSLCYKIPCSEERDMETSFNEDETNGYSAGDLQMAQENTAGHVTCHDVGQAGNNRRRQMLASLPDLFYTISTIFGSKNCTSVTKQELVHKILSYNSDIEDTGDIEELLHLLEELVPDWICRKTMSSGDIMYSISRTSDPKSVRSRLVEAV